MACRYSIWPLVLASTGGRRDEDADLRLHDRLPWLLTTGLRDGLDHRLEGGNADLPAFAMHQLDLLEHLARSADASLMAFQLHPSIPAGDMDVEGFAQLAEQVCILLGREGLEAAPAFRIEWFRWALMSR